MLGFLAAVITILFAFVNSQAFIKYKRVGYLDVFFYLYILTIINLIVSAGLSFLGLSDIQFVWVFRFMLLSFAANMVQITLITFIISKIAFQGSHERDASS